MVLRLRRESETAVDAPPLVAALAFPFLIHPTKWIVDDELLNDECSGAAVIRYDDDCAALPPYKGGGS